MCTGGRLLGFDLGTCQAFRDGIKKTVVVSNIRGIISGTCPAIKDAPGNHPTGWSWLTMHSSFYTLSKFDSEIQLQY